jgi:hypothetical protein
VAELRSELPTGLDHFRRSTKVNVCVAMIERFGAHMIRDMAVPMLGGRTRAGSHIAEVWKERPKPFDLFEFDKIGRVSHAVDEPHGLIAVTSHGEVLKH